MTIGEALTSDLMGLVSVDKLLLDQSLNPNETYNGDKGKGSAYQLALAYGLIEILIMPNLSEGDWSRSWGDRSSVQKMIANIFAKFDPDNNPFPDAINTITDITDMW